MNSRDIRELLKGNVDPRLGRVLISFNEEIRSQRQMILKLAGMFDAVLNNQMAQANAVGELQRLRPFFKQMQEMNTQVGSDPVLTGEHDDQR